MWDLALFSVAAVVSLIALWSLPKFWRGEGIPVYERSSRSFWVWGEGALQGWIRSAPVGIVGCAGIVVAGVGGTFREATTNQTLWTVANLALYAGFAVFLACVGLAITVTLFNVPKRVVPPSLRHQPGLLRYWLDQRKRAR